MTNRIIAVIFSVLVSSTLVVGQTPGPYPINGTIEEKRDALLRIMRSGDVDSARSAKRALEDADPIVRATAASVIALLPTDEARRELAVLTNDRSEFVRKEAVLALGRAGSDESARVLINVLKRDKYRSVKAAAALALGNTRSKDGIEPLLSVLSKRPRKKDAFLRRAAAKSIGMILTTGDSGVATPKDFIPSGSSGVRITHSLNTRIEAVLSKVLNNKKEDPDTRREAAFALNANESFDILEGCRNSEDFYLAAVCNEIFITLRERGKQEISFSYHRLF